MEICRSLDEVKRNECCILTTGTFDGVHLGHQSIIATLKNSIDHPNECTTIVTFEPHPQFVVTSHKKNELKLLTTIAEKIAILKELNINRLIILPFDEQFARLSSEQFIEEILVNRIGFSKIVIGYDHAFGRSRQGNYEVLARLSKTHHYQIIVVPPFGLDGMIISSTKIRKLVQNGQIEQATRYLGRFYCLMGTVIKGEGRGRTLNIPTANLKPMAEEKLIPKDGIYAVWARVGNQQLKAVLYIGSKPTFSPKERSIELHLFNYSGNLYGQILTVEFKARIRDDYQFDSVEKLIEQIEHDKQETLKILTN